MKQGIPAFMPSRLFIYYNERAIEHTTKSDSGAQIRDGIKSVNKQGVCPESEWDYNISKFTKKPSKNCYADALKDKVIQYASISQDLILLKSCLALGFPIVFGISVFDSFESDEVAKTGIVPMPQKSESSLEGHCIKSVGYDDSKERFIVKNSWGTSWGDKGYCYIPYEYVLNQGLASDFWKITLIGN
jgi:C1A family cysteine protease